MFIYLVYIKPARNQVSVNITRASILCDFNIDLCACNQWGNWTVALASREEIADWTVSLNSLTNLREYFIAKTTFIKSQGSWFKKLFQINSNIINKTCEKLVFKSVKKITKINIILPIGRSVWEFVLRTASQKHNCWKARLTI